jgi:uncharacterized SAM-binding protein YcdF (DUF218 family)
MFFVLSKVLNFFLVPSNIMVGLGIAGVALLAIGHTRAGRWMLVASVVLIAAVGILPIGSGLALPLEERFARWDATRGPPTGIIVLGGGVIRSEISSDRGEIVLGNAAERIIAAGELARRYPGARVVFTGGNSNLVGAGPIEADFVGRFFEKIGVLRARVIVERKSHNTTENAALTKQLVMPKAGERWLLVTSAMHMPRAVGVFQKAGFAVDAYPVDYQTTGTKDVWTLSSALTNIRKTNRAVHEWIGLMVYWITGQISVPFPGPISEIPLPAHAGSCNGSEKSPDLLWGLPDGCTLFNPSTASLGNLLASWRGAAWECSRPKRRGAPSQQEGRRVMVVHPRSFGEQRRPPQFKQT